jgi:hypothetical protein
MTLGARMSERTYGRNCFVAFLAAVALMTLAPAAEAMSPVITRHDAHLMEKEVRINLAWQSDEPVAKIIASAGREQVVIESNIDNERNEGGYSGEIDIVVPAYLYNTSGEQSMYMSRQSSGPLQQSSVEMYADSASPYNEVVQYTVQLVDEVNQRSTLLKDKVCRAEPAYPQPGQRPQPGSAAAAVAVNAKDPLNTALNTTIGLIGKIGQAPEVKNVRVSNWADNRVSVSFDATGGKGLDRVVFEVRDSSGTIASQSTILCNSEKQCTKQSDPFVLNPGRYALSVMAVDIQNSNSKKSEQEFQVPDGTGSVQRPIQQPAQQPVQQTLSHPATADDVPVVTVPGL